MVRSFDVKRFRRGSTDRIIDPVAIEAPLAVRVLHWRKQASFTDNLAVTMRTPGADTQLAVGLLLTEGVIADSSEIVDVRALGIEPANEVLVQLAPNVDFDSWRQQRSGFVSSSCGVCGKAGIEQILQTVPRVKHSDWRVTPDLIHALPPLLRDHQPAFHQTGGVHAAALISLNGELDSLFEDIGRHNALDKLIGQAMLNQRLPLDESLVFMSSRCTFELIQKAAMAGVQMLASVGSPSSLAIETARELGLTLLCFVRDQRFNVYSGDWRLDL